MRRAIVRAMQVLAQGRHRVPGSQLGSHRASIGLVSLALIISACGGTGTPISPSTQQEAGPPTTVSPSAPATAAVMAGSFTDLPFTFTLPDGWLFGKPRDIAAELADLAKSDPAEATKLQAVLAQSPPVTSEFVAYDIGSHDQFTPNVDCNTLDLGEVSPADALARGQAQNVDGVAKLPGIVGAPTADRMTLPVGETVRVRWRMKDAASGADISSIGYLFVAGPTVYTCVFSAGTSTITTHEPEWEAILRTFAAKPSASTLASVAPPGATAAACPAPSAGLVYPHQAPEIEAVLPSIVGGRPLIRWSVRGRCWLEELISDPRLIEQFIAPFTTAANPNPVDGNALVYGVAGRAVLTDPPYFVFAAVRPRNDDEISLALALLFGGAGFKDVAGASDLSHYQQQTIGGKQVYVGTPDMLTQDTHQRGRPYLYENDQYMFLVITDSDAWAADAIGRLP